MSSKPRSRASSARPPSAGPVFHDLLRHFEEHLVNIASRLRRGLEEFEAVLFGKGDAALSGNNAVGEVGLVSNEDFDDVGVSVGVDLLEPVGDVVKGAFFSAVVQKNDPHGALVVRAEPFPPRGVPHLQLHALVLPVNRLDLEIDVALSADVCALKLFGLFM